MIRCLADLMKFFGEGGKMERKEGNPEPTDGRYVIFSESKGVLIDVNDLATTWTGETDHWEDVVNFDKKGGEQIMEAVAEQLKANTGEDPALRLVPAPVTLIDGDRHRTSRSALKTRLLVP